MEEYTSIYNNIYNSIPSQHKDLTLAQKKETISLICKLSQNEQTTLFALIRIYHTRNLKTGYIFDVPYKGEKVKESNKEKEKDHKDSCNLKFNLEELPITLKHIVYKYCKLNPNIETR